MSQALPSIQYIGFRKLGSNTGGQTCFLPRASSSLIAPLGDVDLPTNHKPTLPSHKSLMDINFR